MRVRKIMVERSRKKKSGGKIGRDRESDCEEERRGRDEEKDVEEKRRG